MSEVVSRLTELFPDKIPLDFSNFIIITSLAIFCLVVYFTACIIVIFRFRRLIPK